MQLNRHMTSHFSLVGHEQTPILLIDDLIEHPEQLVDFACEQQEQSKTAATSDKHGFQQQDSDFYPGIRKQTPLNYVTVLGQLLPFLQQFFNLSSTAQADIMLSAFSISTTPEQQLRPIQMLPHFDSPNNAQYAMVHYLCDIKHGGTSFYRHNTSGFERITEPRLAPYRHQLKQQAIAANLHKNPQYINGDSHLFTRTHQVEAKFNRAIIYPSNVLHSGNIQANLGLLSDPKKGRLTISNFILIR